ncbi:SPOC domain-containing protein 1 isoform X2 [Podarcis raffonei]|uniref:SPOC domain-containing protein 1 isoform X2 n=1 Tax=Podarcis raffonei TaxID=65483 RepID=UPI0023295DCA|nr:SPOC domain-containing protein 1 isoform X2 [Podarcis raffonei]
MKGIATKLTKPCYVLLKDTNQQRKQKHCLMHLNPKKLPQKMQNKRKDGIYEKLRVALFDLLDKNCTKKLKTSPKIKNAGGQLEYEKVNKVESGLELDTSVQVLSSGESDPGETNNDFGIKAERTKSTDISALCDEGIFARFSSKESCHDNSIIHHCHEEEIEKEKECLDTSPIHETQYQEYQDLDTSPSFLGETSVSDTSQNLIATFHTEALQTHKIYSSFSSENSFSETKVSKISRRMGASLLPDTTVKKADICQANSEFEPNFVSGANLKLDLKDTVSDIMKSEMSIGERIVSDSMDASAEEFLKEQVGVEEHETLNPNNTMSGNKNMDSCWFLLKIDEVIDQEDSVCATDEENNFRDLECGDVILDHGLDFPQLDSKSGYQSFTDGTAVTKLSEKRRISSDHQEDLDGEINNVEESVNTQPAEENSSVQELSGSTVKLLGTQTRSDEKFTLGKLIELEDSSDDEVYNEGASHISRGRAFHKMESHNRKGLFSCCYPLDLMKEAQEEGPQMMISVWHKESQGNCALLLPNSKNEGKLYSETVIQHKPLNLDDDRTKKNKRRQGPSKAPAPVHSSQLTQEQSRRKVVDALREALLKRLDDLPDLCVQKKTVVKIAKKVEQEIFKRFCCVEQNYKNKYRSLLFNLKSAENQYLFRKLILGEITPKRLVQMSSFEMAPPELAEWRAKENKRALEIIEREEQEAPRCCSAKFNHKGIVEIEREAEEDLMFQEIFGSQSPKEVNHSSEIPRVSVRDPDDVQRNCSEDPNYLSCFGQITAGGEQGFKSPTYKHALKQKANATKHWHPSTMFSEEGERPLHVDSPISPHIPKKHRRMEKQPRNSAIWEGVIHMFSVKQFVAKAYPVSGSSCNLSQALPHLLQGRGCILPDDVWSYLDSIWPANSKEMGVIRFHPSLPKGFDSYNTLYSYLNNKQRYGIVDSNQMEIFMVPLAAYQPVPSKLHTFGGPGLEPCHPSLLLGLILPKRTCTGSLETMSNPLPKARRKNITLKDSTGADSFSLPQVDTCQTWPPPQLSIDSLLCGNEGPLLVLPRQEPLSADAVFVHPEELGGETFHRDPSSLRHEEAGNEANHFPVGDTLQSLSSSWAVEQWNNLSLGILGAQPHQDRDHVQLCGDSDQSYIWKTLELLLSAEPVCPDQHEADGANIIDSSFLQSILCADALPPCEVSQVLSSPQIPCVAYVAGEPNSLLQETLSLIQQVESHLQTQGPNAQMP